MPSNLLGPGSDGWIKEAIEKNEGIEDILVGGTKRA
jgi:hypothetical protein